MDQDQKISLARRVAVISGIFCGVVALLLILNFWHMKQHEPLESKTIEVLVERLAQEPGNEELKEEIRSFDHDAWIQSVAISPDGRRLASGGFREEVYLWDLQTGRRYDTLKAESAFSDRHILRIVFLPDPHGLITGATDGKIRLWRLPD